MPPQVSPVKRTARGNPPDFTFRALVATGRLCVCGLPLHIGTLRTTSTVMPKHLRELVIDGDELVYVLGGGHDMSVSRCAAHCNTWAACSAQPVRTQLGVHVPAGMAGMMVPSC